MGVSDIRKINIQSELEGLVYTATFRSSINNRPCDTPAMTLQGLQRLVIILGGKMVSDFRRIVRRNVFLKALVKRSIL
jgi:hypothetical protein